MLMKSSHFAALTFSAFTIPAFAMLTEINITAIEPFADGASFGNTGACERVRGTFKGALDPRCAASSLCIPPIE